MSDSPSRSCLLIALTCLFASPAQGADADRVNAAVTKGVEFLESQQQSDGSFRDRWHGEGYPMGETALALLTLLKGGVAPDHTRIEAGFQWLYQQPLKRTYEVSVAILALEARYTPEASASIQDQDPLASQIRGRFKRNAPARDRRWLQQAVEFLLKAHDVSGSWKYPGYGDPDLSNAQFAVLALSAARRMGVKLDKSIFLSAAEYLLTHQEGDGPSVSTFPVPAADRPIQGLHDRRTRKPKRKGTRERGPDEADGTVTRHTMKARGWGYRPGDGTRGSMTAAGLAILVVAKSELESERGYDRVGPQIDQALRDGAAWLAHRFRADRNPGAEPDWLFYYLYTLERAGTLLALDRFGGRDWYHEGADVILGHQQPDGRITADTGGQSDGMLAGTCLGILFLKRSTVPVVKRVRTGDDLQVPQNGGTTQSGAVSFKITLAPGSRVSVAGDFNAWSATANPLQDPDGDGTFELSLTLSPGRYSYKFVVDGDSWRPDPANSNREPDGLGGENSVLTVE